MPFSAFSSGDFMDGGTTNSAAAASSSGGGMGTDFGTPFVLNMVGSERANWQNRKAAETSRDYQERMSNSSWQRSVKDMIAAGINPMLAASKGGASTPEGAMARNESITAGAVHSGQSGQLLAANIEKLKAETENVRADTSLKGVQETTTGQQGVLYNSQTNNLIAEIHNIRARLPHIENEAEKIRLEQRLVVAESRLRELEGTHSALDIPRAAAESNISDSVYGRYGRPLLKDISSLVSSAAGAAGGVAAARFATRGISANARGARGVQAERRGFGNWGGSTPHWTSGSRRGDLNPTVVQRRR